MYVPVCAILYTNTKVFSQRPLTSVLFSECHSSEFTLDVQKMDVQDSEHVYSSSSERMFRVLTS
jgi:hypothetical protein